LDKKKGEKKNKETIKHKKKNKGTKKTGAGFLGGRRWGNLLFFWFVWFLF